MTTPVPTNPKICHIVHVDKLASILNDGYLWSDATVQRRHSGGTTIGMASIKARRLSKSLNSYPNLHVGDCVPFYLCPRSVMLYMFHMNNHPDISYTGGQTPIVHLVADLQRVVQWANQNGKRWVFTDSNAGSYYFNDFSDLAQLGQINWGAVQATGWRSCREQKQSEFLIEDQFPWELVEDIGVYSDKQYQQVSRILSGAQHRPAVEVKRNWYY